MYGVVHITWYCSLFRKDDFADRLAEIGSVALRYGATSQYIYRSRDDRYSFLQVATFKDKTDFERYWEGEEFRRWRSQYSSWFHLPVAYTWYDVLSSGHVELTNV
jgi:hypothetical protein